MHRQTLWSRTQVEAKEEAAACHFSFTRDCELVYNGPLEAGKTLCHMSHVLLVEPAATRNTGNVENDEEKDEEKQIKGIRYRFIDICEKRCQ